MSSPRPAVPAGGPRPNRAARRRAAAAAGSAAALAAGGLALGGLGGLPAAHAAGTYEVTRLADDADPGSLRWAITEADGDPGSTITFAAGLTGTITLASDLPVITESTTIVGPGSGVLAISGNGAYNPLDVDGAVTVAVSGLTLTNPDPDAVAKPALIVTGGATFTGTDLVVSDTRYDSFAAGPITCSGSTLALVDSAITGNANLQALGGVARLANCTTTVTGTTVTGNRAGTVPGFMGVGTGSVTVVGSTMADNEGGLGGPLNLSAVVDGEGPDVTVRDSTISGNSGAATPAINAFLADLVITNSTITGNVATARDVLSISRGTATLVQTTITGNTAPGETLYSGSYSCCPNSLMTIGTILAGNDTPTEVHDFYGTLVWTSEASVIGSADEAIDVDVGGNQTGVSDPGVGPLADNGGPTPTMALLPDSPALDAGPLAPPVFPGSEWDQRGEPFVRVSGGQIDVGAYEEQPGPAAVLTYAGATELPAGAGTAELATRVDPELCRSGSVEFLVDGQAVATVPVDPATGLAAVTTAVPVGSTAFTVEARLVDTVCAADPVRVTVTVVGGAPSFTG